MQKFTYLNAGIFGMYYDGGTYSINCMATLIRLYQLAQNRKVAYTYGTKTAVLNDLAEQIGIYPTTLNKQLKTLSVWGVLTLTSEGINILTQAQVTMKFDNAKFLYFGNHLSLQGIKDTLANIPIYNNVKNQLLQAKRRMRFHTTNSKLNSDEYVDCREIEAMRKYVEKRKGLLLEAGFDTFKMTDEQIINFKGLETHLSNQKIAKLVGRKSKATGYNRKKRMIRDCRTKFIRKYEFIPEISTHAQMIEAREARMIPKYAKFNAKTKEAFFDTVSEICFCSLYPSYTTNSNNTIYTTITPLTSRIKTGR